METRGSEARRVCVLWVCMSVHMHMHVHQFHKNPQTVMKFQHVLFACFSNHKVFVFASVQAAPHAQKLVNDHVFQAPNVLKRARPPVEAVTFFHETSHECDVVQL